MGEVNQAALKYLLLHLNTLQSAFEFEILPLDRNEPLARLISCQSRIKEALSNKTK